MPRSENYRNDTSLYLPHQNCWRVEKANDASLIIDCAPYYRALHEAISRAQKSVFILGWDIDSRIELLRGPEAQNHSLPTRLFDLIKWKAEQNTNIHFYLNRWDYTLYQAGEREGLSLLRWRFFMPGNVHYHLDNMHPIGGCHHQKIVVIDDELAFLGGMDIAIGRWDHRNHKPQNRYRLDPGGTYSPHTRHLYPPHHDAMIVVSGPCARALGELARKRWRSATSEEPIAISEILRDGKPQSWPAFITSQFTDIPIAISRTLPSIQGHSEVREVERLYFDQIRRAENFIYMENQYFTSIEIAEALNCQLKSKPQLRIVLISCHEPQGIMERKAMWGGRVLFRDALVAGGLEARVLMAYPVSRERNDTEAIRIHSKVMIVDDSILRIGSSNINNRSLRLDTECDLSIEARTPDIAQRIAAIRNDMLREHTGFPLRDIAAIIENGENPAKFTDEQPESTQHLRPINDEKYRHQSFMKLAIRIADPHRPFFYKSALVSKDSVIAKGKLGKIFLALPFFGLLIVLAFLWKWTPLSHYANPSRITPLLTHARQGPWAVPSVIGIYVAATLIFFPLTILVFATSISFPPLQALGLAFSGMLCSACCGYGVGRMAGFRFLRVCAGRSAEKISGYTRNGGVLGVTLLRMVPVAPLGVVDFSLGMMRVPFLTYITGTILGLAPGILIFTLLGHSLERLWHDLTFQNALIVGFGLVAWFGAVVLSHIAVKRWRRDRTKAHDTP